MSTILVTGASGFIGKALSTSLVRSGKHKVVCMSRHKPQIDVEAAFVKGEFHDFEDLRGLDGHEIDAVVHLGAVTGGCSELDGMMVNVEGTRRLMRYLMDRGCRKFVMASSIAVVGLQSVKFRPVALPMPDEHPCLDRDGYGFSKYMMEEVTRYHARQNEGIDVINIRLAAICPDEPKPGLAKVGPLGQWALASISRMVLSDAVRVFTMSAESPMKPGVRVMNAVGPKVFAEDTVPEIMRAWYPDLKIDLSHYERPGHEHDPIFDIRRVREEIGFVPEFDPFK